MAQQKCNRNFKTGPNENPEAKPELVGRLVRDAPGRLWKIIEDHTGPYGNLYRLLFVGGTTTELVSGYELLHYYTPEEGASSCRN